MDIRAATRAKAPVQASKTAKSAGKATQSFPKAASSMSAPVDTFVPSEAAQRSLAEGSKATQKPKADNRDAVRRAKISRSIPYQKKELNDTLTESENWSEEQKAQWEETYRSQALDPKKPSALKNRERLGELIEDESSLAKNQEAAERLLFMAPEITSNSKGRVGDQKRYEQELRDDMVQDLGFLKGSDKEELSQDIREQGRPDLVDALGNRAQDLAEADNLDYFEKQNFGEALELMDADPNFQASEELTGTLADRIRQRRETGKSERQPASMLVDVISKSKDRDAHLKHADLIFEKPPHGQEEFALDFARQQTESGNPASLNVARAELERAGKDYRGYDKEQNYKRALDLYKSTPESMREQDFAQLDRMLELPGRSGAVGDVLSTALKSKDADTRNRAMKILDSSYQSDNNSRKYAAAGVLSENPSLLSEDRVRDLAQTNMLSKTDEGLDAMIRVGHLPRDKETRSAMVERALNSGSPELIKEMQTTLPQGVDLSEHMADIGGRFQENLLEKGLEAYQERDTSSPFYKLGKVFRMQQLHGEEGGKYRGEFDDEALQGRVEELMASPQLSKDLQKLSREAVSEWRETPRGSRAVKKQIDYLSGDDFRNRLRLMSPKKRDQELSSNLAQLMLLAPEQAPKVLEGVMLDLEGRAHDFPLEGLATTGTGGQIGRTEAFASLREHAGQFGKESKLVKDSLKTIEHLPATASRKQITRVLGKSGISSKNINRVQALLGAYSLGSDIITGNGPDSFQEGAGQAASGVYLTGWAARPASQALARGLGATTPISLRAMPKTLTMLRGARLFSRGTPLVGDALGAFSDAVSSYQSFDEGMKAKGGTYLAATGMGIAAVATGVMSFGAANAWNPVGWAALGLGATAGALSFVGGRMDGRDDELAKDSGYLVPAALAYHSMTGVNGTQERYLTRAMSGRSKEEMQEVRADYKARYDVSLQSDIAGDSSFSDKTALLRLSQGYSGRHDTGADVRALYKAMDGTGTNNSKLIEILAGRSPEELRAIARKYAADYPESLRSAVNGDTIGSFHTIMMEILYHNGA